MPNTVTRAVGAIRDRIPPLTSIPMPRRFDERVLGREPGPASDLAEPPADSGLLPVRGDFGLPFVGHQLEMMRYGTEYILRRYQHYGPVSWSGGFGQRMVTVAGPDATQEVLTNRDKAFSQDGWAFLIDKFFHRGLMLLDFDEHMMHRRIMQQAFTKDRLVGYVDQMGPVLRRGQAGWPVGRPFKLYWALKQLTLDVATRVFMAEDRADNAAEISRSFVDTVRAPTALLRYNLPGGRWAAGLDGRRVLERYFRTELPAHRASDGDDLFSALCHAQADDGEAFTDDDIVNHMIFLMMAAHDTATITSSAVAYHLAKHPEWQQRAREESLALGDKQPDFADLEGLRTLDLVIKEALRLTAPVPSYARRAVKDTAVLGHYVPKGSIVSVNPQPNHFLPEIWSRPFDFDPERFDEPRREDKAHRMAWIPFGGGVHKCIGMHFGTLEVKLLLHELLRGYRWSVPDGYEMRWDYVSLPVPVDGLPVTLTPRQ